MEDNPDLEIRRPRKFQPVSQAEINKEIEGAISTALMLMDMDLNDPSLKDTPNRFRRYLQEFMQPINLDEVLGKGFEHGCCDTMVTQSHIPFRMICEHHLLPAIGTANIGYLPNGRVVGLSKLTRLVQAVGTEKPSLQESICDRIAELLNDRLKPKGVIVTISAEHGCMACRGINSPGVITSTSSIRGLFLTVPAAREEFFNTIKLAHGVR